MVIDVLAPLALALAALAYYRRCATLSSRGRPVPGWRQICFGASVLLLVAADLPPLANVAEDLVVAHMAQHLLIADLAALFFCLGLTGPVLQPILAVRWLGWLRAFGNPLVAFPVWALSLYVWHLAFLYEGVLDSELLHLAQHGAFFGFGLAMWLPLVGPLPTPAWFTDLAKLGYVVAVRFAGAVLANILIWSGEVLYPAYGQGEAERGIGALSDQGTAGNLMMIETGAVTLGLFAWLFFRAANRGVEKQELLDLADLHGVELDPARAARAVNAGQGAALRERILDDGTRRVFDEVL
ncbi:MAG: cytochrome c oxidase assembly protein [Solirubrobacterales bacterium]